MTNAIKKHRWQRRASTALVLAALSGGVLADELKDLARALDLFRLGKPMPRQQYVTEVEPGLFSGALGDLTLQITSIGGKVESGVIELLGRDRGYQWISVAARYCGPVLKKGTKIDYTNRDETQRGTQVAYQHCWLLSAPGNEGFTSLRLVGSWN